MSTDSRELDEITALQLLVSNSSDMLSRHAPDGTYRYASPATRKLLGYDPEELVGRSAYELFHPDDLEAITASHEGILESSDLSTVEYRIRHKLGHWIWFETTSHTVRDPETGQVLEIQTSSRDVSFRKMSEERERAAELRFRLAMTNAPIGMALMDLDGRWLEVNGRLCQLLGRSEAEVRSLRIADITHPDDLDVDVVQMERLRAGVVDRYSVEKRYLRADGRAVWCQLSVSAVRGDDGQAPYLIAQIQDISERKRYHEELHNLNARLAQSNAELERFASVASHDLRSPLATICGLLDLVLAQAGDLSHEALGWLERARGQSDRLTETVDSLLELARVGQRPLLLTPIDLNDVVADTIESLRRPLAEADVHLDVQWLPTVEVDEAQLRLVFQNLLENALKFREPARPLTITISASERAGDWEVRVEDNGVGLAPERVDTVFEPSASTSPGSNGAGIGLATCRRILARHGGRIRAEAVEGGARFIFTLPKQRAVVEPVGGSSLTG